MATSRNKTGSSGMRILWIPGKKKQPKGSYNPTKKSNLSPNHQQKKIEPWSLGGSKGQEDLLKSEIPGGDMASSPSLINCLPQTLGISAACGDANQPEEGAVGGVQLVDGEEEKLSPIYLNVNGVVHIKTDPESSSISPRNVSPQPPMSPRLGPLANIDEDEHENDFDDPRDDYCGTSSNTATLLLKDRKVQKPIQPITEKPVEKDIQAENEEDDSLKKEERLDMADGVPHMRGLSRKEALERNYREQTKGVNGMQDKKNKKGDTKGDTKQSGMNEKAVDCLYVGLMCCECSIQ